MDRAMRKTSSHTGRDRFALERRCFARPALEDLGRAEDRMLIAVNYNEEPLSCLRALLYGSRTWHVVLSLVEG